MALFGKLFGRKPFAELKAEAYGLREAGDLGAAKLRYERASDARDATDEERAAAQAEANACCDAIAEARLAEAQQLMADGQLELALSELTHAHDTAVSETLRARIQGAIDDSQRVELREQLDAPGEELDEDGRFETLGGNWETDQHAEYAGYGEGFKQALLKLNEGDVEPGKAALEVLLEETPKAVYLWFEVARARLSTGDDSGAEEAFSTFLARIDHGAGGDTRLSAHMTLAALRNEAGDMEGAIGHYQDALEAMPEDPRTYLAMGSLLRQQGLAEEALDILHSGLSVLAEGQPHFRLWHECGLAHAAVGQADQAIHFLEQVVEFFATRQHLDLPPEGTRRLAELYEEQGNLPRAADLYGMLAAGSDVENLLRYHLEAARLLSTLDQRDDARKMLLRARELAGDADAEAAAEVDAQLAQLSHK